MGLDDHVLQQLAEGGFDRALVMAVDLEVVGDRAHVCDLGRRRLGEDQPGAVAVLGARGIELLERFQPRADAGQSRLHARAARSARLSRSARAPASAASRSARSTRNDSRAPRARAIAVFCRLAILLGAHRFDPEIAAFSLELGELLANPLLGRVGALHRMAKRGRGVDRREHLAARRLDVPLEPLDVALDLRVLELFGLQRLGRLAGARRRRIRGSFASRFELQPGRLATRLQLLDL